MDEKAPVVVNETPYVADDVYPLHTLDHNPNYVDWVMRYNDVLDADMLKKSLSRLLEIGDWRKLGGRFRYKVCPVSTLVMGVLLTMRSRMGCWKSLSQDHLQGPERMYLSHTM